MTYDFILTWLSHSIGDEAAGLLYFPLLLLIAFLASRLAYGWVDKAGLQQAGFSPTAASILTAPFLVISYSVLLFVGFDGASYIESWLFLIIFYLALVPILPFLALLLAIYLRGGFRGRKSRILWMTIVSLSILEILWICFVGTLSFE